MWFARERLRQADEFERRPCLCIALSSSYAAHAQTEADIGARRHVREERVVLEYGGRRALGRRQVRYVLAADRYPALVRF
jgi:hypothetical protein